jgi:serpin B
MQSVSTCLAFLSTLLFAANAFASDPSNSQIPEPPGVAVGSDVTGGSAPQPTDQQISEFVDGQNRFALDMYHQTVSEEDGQNFFFSPYSIVSAFGMVYAGASGDTADQIKDVLHYDLGQDTHAAIHALSQTLASRAEQTDPEQGDPFRLTMVNQGFCQTGFSFLTSYLDVLAQDYGSAMHLLDFETAPDPARKSINGWMAAVTHDRILELLPEGAVTTLSRLVLVNAIYFKAAWADPFPKAATGERAFHRLDGSTTQTAMMTNRSGYGFAAVDDAELIQLDYVGGDLSMVLIVPDTDKFASVESQLSGSKLKDMLDALAPANILLTMPRWTNTTGINLKHSLSAMGMSTPFDPNQADFSGMSSESGLFVSGAFHKAFVTVDEEGTEAAAATAITVGVMSLPPIVTVDRPFIYLIRDKPTGTILFMGRVLDPTL